MNDNVEMGQCLIPHNESENEQPDSLISEFDKITKHKDESENDVHVKDHDDEEAHKKKFKQL